METRFKISVLGLALVLAGCGGQDEVETSETVVLDTPSTGMSPGGIPGGMGAMGGMGPGAMSAEWQQHMAQMRSVRGDSLRAMIPMHRQLTTRMMDGMGGGMGMAGDSAWMATRDSLRRDLDRMQDMTPAEMEDFLEEHDARMQRMLRMHQAAPGSGAPGQ